MFPRRLAALVVVVALALALPATALAHTRLAGEFAMTGRITAAHNVLGEHVGETVTRMWDFLAPCPAGQCSTETLVRSRVAGTDTLLLHRNAGVLSHWIAQGSFFAPLRCGSRVYPRGERVFFTIRVRISAVTMVNGAPVATAVKAGYSSYQRTNRTRCVSLIGHDAAVYAGTLVTSPVPPAPTPAPG